MTKGTGAEMASLRWTSQDLEALPDDGKRYEIIDGELYVSRQPHWYHQLVCAHLASLLEAWSRETKAGMANVAPGIVFAEDNDVVADVVWVSRKRLTTALQADGMLHSAPELIAEVLSPGAHNVARDREAKLKLYSRRGVLEYWIVSWQERYVEGYRRENALLKLQYTLYENDVLQSPHLPGFRCQVKQIFAGIS